MKNDDNSDENNFSNDCPNDNSIYFKVVNMNLNELSLYLKKENFRIASLEDIALLRVAENKRAKFIITKDRELFKEDSIFDYGPYLTKDSVIMFKDNEKKAKIKIFRNERFPFVETKIFYIPYRGVFIVENYRQNKKSLAWQLNFDMINKLLDYPTTRFSGDIGEKMRISQIVYHKTLPYLMAEGDFNLLNKYIDLLGSSNKDYIRIVPEETEDIENSPLIKNIFYGISDKFNGVEIYCNKINEKDKYYAVLLKNSKNINKNNLQKE
jgi:predicted nucleic acid-binding protein